MISTSPKPMVNASRKPFAGKYIDARQMIYLKLLYPNSTNMASSKDNASTGHHLTHPKYRPDIDGLRAIAILSVVGFHAFPNLVSGGFIGVDIFFVISGYLISTIIFDSLEHNSFSFVEFYSRRIKRIFPALILVLIACFVFGWFVLLPSEYKQLGKHIAGGAGFVSNFIFWKESGYFDNAAETKPLLHLWSLGVEEQFYIVWPLLLWYAWKQRLNLLTIVIAVGFISFALNIVQINGGHAEAAFYSPQTRFWELLMGSLLAYTTLRKWNLFPKLKHWLDKQLGKIIYAQPPEADGKSLHNIQSLFGAGLIVVGVVIITKENHFPGWRAVLPTLGAVMIISAGTQAWLNRAVLSNRVLVWFGLISFPLYLWHWPLLSFARIVENETPSHEVRIAAVLISVVLAALTFKLIEKPIRFGKFSGAITITLFVMMVFVGYMGYNSYARDGLGFRPNIKAIALQAADLEPPPYEQGQGWLCETVGDADCQLEVGSNPTAVVIGDSHAPVLYLGLKKIYREKGIALADFGGHGGCPPYLGLISKDGLTGGDWRKCLIRISSVLETILATDSIKEVILVSRGPLYTSGHGFGNFEEPAVWTLNLSNEPEGKRTNTEVFKIVMTRTLTALQKAGKHVTYVLDEPELGFDIKSCVDVRPFTLGSKVRNPCAVSKADYIERNKEHRALVDNILKQFPNVRVVDLAEALCDEKLCYGKKDNVVLYKDDDHLSQRGAEFVTQKLKSKFLD